MDELPDLQTDADVDALMGRLRARLSPPPAPLALARRDIAPPPSDAGVLAELAAAQEGLATAVMHAMTAIADALDELRGADEEAAERAVPARIRRPAAAAAATRRPRARARRRG